MFAAGDLRVRIDARLRVEREGSLVIEKMEESDQGQYECEVETELRTVVIKHTVDILKPPTARTKPRNGRLEVMKGSNSTLECLGSGNPKPSIRWVKEGSERIVLSEKKELKLTQVTEEHSGIYICTVFNDLGDSAKAKMVIDITCEYTVNDIRSALVAMTNCHSLILIPILRGYKFMTPYKLKVI